MLKSLAGDDWRRSPCKVYMDDSRSPNVILCWGSSSDMFQSSKEQLLRNPKHKLRTPTTSFQGMQQQTGVDLLKT